ncbi:LAGLIDADG family homing endonuclease [Halobellus sp. EA9]|uniref:LAGLIDADG family homing endonuclease n=1 Tax=Halobellus sp. EA9 TaxID=3421647 RepID=UPI003EC03F39
MSEADASADDDTPAGREIWIEKFRPERLADIHGQEEIVDRLQSYVDRDDLPHLLFAGPAGVGKCVTGETPVLTNHGVERIGSVVGDVEGFDDPDDDLEVLSLTDSNDFEYVRPSHVFGKRTSELRRIETRDGNAMEVTPEHKLLVATEDGLRWKEAAEIADGDRIARPRRTPIPSGNADGERVALDWLDAVDDDRIRVSVTDAFAAEFDLPETTVSPSALRALDASTDRLRAGVESIQYVSASGGRSRPVTPPWRLTPELARFVGLAVAEARIENGRIKFYNTDDGLCDAFASAAESLFALDPERGVRKDVPYVALRSKTLTHLLRASFDVFESASGGTGIGSTLVAGDDESRAAFLRAMFDGEAHVSDHGIIELIQKNEAHITLLSYLLSSFGVPSRRKTVEKSATNGSGTIRECHALYISGAPALRRFSEQVGFDIDAKQRKLEANARKASNPSHDTIPRQRAARRLCERLNLPVESLLSNTLDPKNPGRETHRAELTDVVEAATERLESAQEVLSRIEALSRELDTTSAIPATWIGTRESLEPIPVRRDVSESTGVRSDRLLEYADGRRTPYASRVCRLVAEFDAGSDPSVPDSPSGGGPDIERLQRDLSTCVDALGVSYERIAEGTDLRGLDVNNLLNTDDHELGSLARFETVADRLRTVANEMLSLDVIELLDDVSRVADSDLYYDEVTHVETIDESRRVYDLTVPASRNYVAGDVPTVMHNTTAATAIARELYGDDWEENFLELNASDERGIDVVRDRIKNFARSSFGGHDYRIIFLDEADSLCVPPGTEVVTGYPSSPEVKPIEEVSDDGEPIPSVDFETNDIQSDKGKLVDSGVADFFEVELADGRTITASLTHPFFTVNESGRLVETELRDLSPGDEIADFKDEVGVSRCEICGDWTAGRFCSLDCKNEGHSRGMQGSGNPMYGTEWSDERREKIVEKLADGRFAGENNPNYGGEFHGVHVWEMDEETVKRVRELLSEMRSGTSWDEWVVDADPERVKERIGEATAKWRNSLSDDERARVIQKSVENCDYPVCDITGDNNPMRDPEIAQKVSEALKGHEPTGGNIRFSDELGHLVRSDWEYEVAKALQDADVDYEYEPEFELSDSMFHPDFLVGDTVIEVKGVAELWGQTEKVEEFLETYGDEYTFVVVGDGELPHHEHYEREDFDPAFVADGGLAEIETVEIRRIEYSHRGKAYNISMENTPNFMLANGILTHNTDDAQSALRRTMEQFSDNTRFILSCNYSSKIIDPIQSRCAVFRFAPLSDAAVRDQVEEIAASEDIEVTDDGLDALVYAAGGDMRRAINSLQAAATTGDVVDEEAVFMITSTARPEDIEEMVEAAIDGDFASARAKLETLLVDTGMAGGDIIDQLHRSAWDFDLDERTTIRLMERIGEADYRITAGANERVQLEALLASLAAEE